MGDEYEYEYRPKKPFNLREALGDEDPVTRLERQIIESRRREYAEGKHRVRGQMTNTLKVPSKWASHTKNPDYPEGWDLLLAVKEAWGIPRHTPICKVEDQAIREGAEADLAARMAERWPVKPLTGRRSPDNN